MALMIAYNYGRFLKSFIALINKSMLYARHIVYNKFAHALQPLVQPFLIRRGGKHCFDIHPNAHEEEYYFSINRNKYIIKFYRSNPKGALTIILASCNPAEQKRRKYEGH